MAVLRFLKLYRPATQRYLRRKVDEAARHWNAGLAPQQIAVAIDHSDELTAELLQKAVMQGKLRRKTAPDRLGTLRY